MQVRRDPRPDLEGLPRYCNAGWLLQVAMEMTSEDGQADLHKRALSDATLGQTSSPRGVTATPGDL